MKEKQIKVCKGCTKEHIPVPKIAMQGQWLNEIGFSIGERLVVAYDENQIIILKHAEGGTALESGMVAEVPYQESAWEIVFGSAGCRFCNPV